MMVLNKEQGSTYLALITP